MAVALVDAVQSSLLASPTLALVNELGAGAVIGVTVGLLIGAIVWPMMHAPDAMGRGLLLAILFAVGMSIFELIRIGYVTGVSLSTILNAFQGATSTLVGGMIIEGVTRVVLAMLLGAIIGVGSAVPDKLLKGALAGLFLGALIGAVLYVAINQFNFPLNLGFSRDLLVFRIIIAVLTWGVLTTLGGKA